jgi:hypothetical protein
MLFVHRSVADLAESDPLLKLKPYTYDFPTEFQSSLSSAISGVTSLPSLTPSDDIPQYAADHFGPVINGLEVVFYTILDLKKLSQGIVDDPQYTAFANDLE